MKNKESEKVYPVFIKDAKIDFIKEFFDEHTVGSAKTAAINHLSLINLLKPENVDYNILRKIFYDWVKTCIENEARQKVIIETYDEV